MNKVRVSVRLIGIVGIVVCLISAPAYAGRKSSSSKDAPPSNPALQAEIQSLSSNANTGPAIGEQVEAIYAKNGLPTIVQVGEPAATEYVLLMARASSGFLHKALPQVQSAVEAGSVWPGAYSFLHRRLIQMDTKDLSAKEALMQPELQPQILELKQMDDVAHSRSHPDPEEFARLEGQIRYGLQGILDRFGMPTYSMVGVPATEDFVVMVQHQPPDFLHKVLPKMEQAVDQGEADPAAFAQLFDTMTFSNGDPQRYGTVLTCNKRGERVLWKVEDGKHLDARRAALGLEPESFYMAREKNAAAPCPAKKK